MLRVTIVHDPNLLTYRLEGKLIGRWVEELAKCWECMEAADPNPKIRFNLTELSFIDALCKAFLAARYAQGAELVASGCLMRAIVSAIKNATDSQNKVRNCRSEY